MQALKRCKINEKLGKSGQKIPFYFEVRQNSCKFVPELKNIKNIVNGVIWALVGLVVALFVLLRLPAVQGFIGSTVGNALSEKLGTEVHVSRVDLGFFNRVIVDDISMLDQDGKRMLTASRASAKLDVLALSKGKIVVKSAQLFGLKASLYQKNADEKPNFAFVLDSLASKDSTKHTPLDLKINSLIIRHGAVSYNRWDIPTTPHQFSPHHIDANDISAHIILNALKDDSLNVNIKRLAFKENSGLDVQTLSCKLLANKEKATLEDLQLKLPHSELLIDRTWATYQYADGKLDPKSLDFFGSINYSKIATKDLASLMPMLRDYPQTVYVKSTYAGNANHLRVDDLLLYTDDDQLYLHAQGDASKRSNQLKWNADINDLRVSEAGMESLAHCLKSNSIDIPNEVMRLESIRFKGDLSGEGNSLGVKGAMQTGAGDLNMVATLSNKNFSGTIKTEKFNLRQVLDNDKFGEIGTDIQVDGAFPAHSKPNFYVQGKIPYFDYNSYSFKNIQVDGTMKDGLLDGYFEIDDPNVNIEAKGEMRLAGKTPTANLVATVRHISPSAINLLDKWPGTTFSFNVDANVVGRDINTANGKISLNTFTMQSPDRTFLLDNLLIEGENDAEGHHLSMTSDFGNMEIKGEYDYNTIVQSIMNLVGSKLPTLPGLPRQTQQRDNNFTMTADIHSSDWLQELFDIPLDIQQSMHIEGSMNDKNRQLDLRASLPSFVYDDKPYENAQLVVNTPNDTLQAHLKINKIMERGSKLALNLDANAIDNHLSTNLRFANRSRHPFKGQIIADAEFFKAADGHDAAHVNINPSDVVIGDTIWNVLPGDITYSKNHLAVNNVTIKHDNQHIIVNGMATKSPSDSIIVDLKDVDVNYILNLVNFHSVEFGGLATGKAWVSNVFNKPDASAHLTVNKFTFEEGRMGVLTADAELNHEDEQIDIHAVANDGPGQQTYIDGYVSPQRSYIDLSIAAQNSNAEFLRSFCGSFMHDIDVRVNADLRLSGPLSNMNLVGEGVADGFVTITPLNTTYALKNDTIRLIPDEIIFERDTIYDIYGSIGIVNGSLYHEHLTNLSYGIGVVAENLLAYDFKNFGNDTFCGTVFATGECAIKGRSGEVTIDVDVTPEKNSQILYNVSSPDAIGNNEFIKWVNRDTANVALNVNNADEMEVVEEKVDIPTDIRMNFLINANPDATLKLIMDEKSGDYIALNGNGVIRATYYNKGSFDMFGNYLIDHGVYKLTIQNVIKKDFQFQQGGSIVFGGDPYNATLNLKALYPVNGVPLSDLNIGRSFTSNNIRVNCLMNITGTPYQPRVEFDLDLPTIGTDAKQMIFSLINSEEEMNQQVLYLLAIGRFYNQGTNNAGSEGMAQQSQTSLAMQSLLSGTISQQLNSVLSSVVNNNNWNFGANISTGDQGFYNAEYEGLLSGRLLNNRLQINGQFGYRDNPNATSSFIGDFDIRYLLLPNGNVAIKVYNQTNDRYFTRNSLNTQGVGLILKKDFNGLGDFIGSKPKKQTVTAPADSTANKLTGSNSSKYTRSSFVKFTGSAATK
ncbi:MAG: translocation/assembly module TamB domain-containing protein [Prevotella sp.]|nr:translocation/assembly module TamB domain-containing protein [Prevotella sp.]